MILQKHTKHERRRVDRLVLMLIAVVMCGHNVSSTLVQITMLLFSCSAYCVPLDMAIRLFVSLRGLGTSYMNQSPNIPAFSTL